MNSLIKSQIIALANKNPQEEICGFIYYTVNGSSGDIFIYPSNNISVDRYCNFEIDPVDYLTCSQKGEICGVYHSHPGHDEAFSSNDVEYIEELGVPLYLYTVDTGKWQEYIPPTYQINLNGLPFIWGLYDCYSTLRNYYRQEFSINVPDYDRGDKFAQDPTSLSLIMNNVQSAGFEIIPHTPDTINETIQIGDVLLFFTPSCSRVLPAHFGIFLGKSSFLHHPENVLSREDQLNHYWISKIAYIARHKNRVLTTVSGTLTR